MSALVDNSLQPQVPTRHQRLRWPKIWARPQGIVGTAMLVFVFGTALLGPLFAPHPLAKPVGAPGVGAGGSALLGTDALGRDVLSRVLDGGDSLLWVAVVSAALIYLVGVGIGLIAGTSRPWVDTALMRLVDLFIAFPPMVLLLVLVAGAGNHNWVVILGVVFVLSPGVARIVRSATLEVATKSYVEAAVARGERKVPLLVNEILPNIAPTIVADFGVRFLGAVFIIASLAFLGFGPQPPAANWALMIAENRQIISLNVWSVLAPGIMIGILTVAVNLVGDAYISTRTSGRA